MARPLRVEYPGAYYHVINRGNAGENIFHTIRDREKFLEYLKKAVERFSVIIHTYCLMTNHEEFMMIVLVCFVDTNLFVRYLTKDDKHKAEAVE